MFCQNCGKLLADGTKFCENCGTPVESEPAVAETSEQVTPSVLAMSAEPVTSDLDEVKAKAQETQAKQEAQPAQPVIVQQTQAVQPQPVSQPQVGYQQPVQPQAGYQQPTYQQPSYQQPSYQQPAYQASNYNAPLAPTEGKSGAIAATVLGGVSIFFDLIFYTSPLGMILGIVGLILALMARKKGYKRGVSTAGLIVSIIGLAIGALLSFILVIAVIAVIADSM